MADASGSYEERAAFLLGLREQGVRSLAVLRAMEAVPRSMFVAPAYAALGNRNVALPIACGQTCPAPIEIARILEAATLSPDLRVLEIGTGSGWGTALLARLVGTVTSIERWQPLAREAETRLAQSGATNVNVTWADAYDLPIIGPFDCVIVHAIADPVPDSLLRVLAPGGRVIHGLGRELTESRKNTDSDLQQASKAPIRLRPLERGLARYG